MKAEHLGADCQNCPLRDAGFVPTQHPQGRLQSDDVLRGEVLDSDGKRVRIDGDRRIAVVGEAPGFVETTYQRPFTGPSGKLLTSVLKHHGFSRSEVLLTNVCLCRPQDNATPPKAAVAACKPRLARELSEYGCTDILALGGTAGTLLVDNPGTITSLRVGPPKPLARWVLGAAGNLDGCLVIPTWHPAYCLRNADAFPALVTDVGKLKESAREPWTEPEWRAVDDVAVALAVIGRLQALEGPFVLDIEVGFDKDEAFDHPNNYALLCLGIAYERGRAVVLGRRALADPTVVSRLRELLRTTPSGAPRKLIAHNGKFDLAGLYPLLGSLELWFDTMLASYCLDERPGNHGLKVLAVEKLGAPRYDDEIKKYIPRGDKNYANIPEPILHKYNAYDVACTWDLYEMFEEALARSKMRPVHDFLVKAANQLMYLELNGIAIDKEYSNQLMGEYLARLEVIESEMDDLIRMSTGHIVDDNGEPVWQKGINPRSPMQVKKYFETQGIRVASTNEATLTALLNRMPSRSPCTRFIETLLRYRRQQKLYSTYIAGIRKRMYRGRIYTTYLLHGSTSGRLASRNPNLQNIVRDKEIRRQFSVSKPGNVLVQCDYANAEARVMTFLAQDEYLREILSRTDPGYKFFNELSDQLYGAGKWGKEEYIRTKAFFYGIGYGRESWSVAKEYGLSAEEGARRYNDFTSLIPGIVAWQASIKDHVLAGKPLITPFGRRRRFWLITEQNKKDVLNEALSYLPQSTASDICLSALIRLRPMLRGLGFLRLTIHDALVAECEEVRQDEVAELLSTVMAEEGKRFTDYIPWPVDISIGKNWGEL